MSGTPRARRGRSKTARTNTSSEPVQGSSTAAGTLIADVTLQSLRKGVSLTGTAATLEIARAACTTSGAPEHRSTYVRQRRRLLQPVGSQADQRRRGTRRRRDVDEVRRRGGAAGV